MGQNMHKVRGSELKVSVTCAAEKGKANQCLIDFLAKKTGVKKKAISIVSGKSNPVKRIQISGMSIDKLLEIFGE